MSVASANVREGRRRAAAGRILLFLPGVFVCLPLVPTASAQTSPSSPTVEIDPLARSIAVAAQRFGIPEVWIRAVIRAESRGNVDALSPKGAMGLMQIMPATWAYLRAKYGFGRNPYDPSENILAGAAYLRELHDRYGSPGFLAAYNAGPTRYDQYRVGGRALPPETLAYVATVAPVIGAAPLTSAVSVASVDPLAWTRARLFITRTGDSASADQAQPDNEISARPLQTAERSEGSAAAAPEKIFVARPQGMSPR